MRSLDDVMHEIITSCTNDHDVAEFLRVRGVQGERGQCGSCPIAVYVMRETGAEHADVVCDYTAIQFAGSTIGQSVDNPEIIQDFIEMFDAGRYTELVK